MELASRIRRTISLFPWALEKLRVVDGKKGGEAFDLALPVMVTGALRVLLRISDFLMVGIALGDAAIAGLSIGFQYYFIGFGMSLAVSSGTISVVSRLQGANRTDRANLAVKQSLWLALVVSLPLTIVAWFYATPLIGLLSDDPAVIDFGGIYLSIVMLSMVPRFWSMIAARAMAGSADTRTPMYVRLVTLPSNIILNAVLIFGLGPAPELGIAGAAIGTVVANTLAGVAFLALFLSNNYAVGLDVGGRQFDAGLMVEILRVGLPLSGMRLVDTFGRFPFLFILGTIGTPALAAFAIGRRVMLLALMPAWGYSTAASTLVGQAIGAGDSVTATDYGWQTLRIGLATQLLVAAVLMIAARPIALAFGTEHIELTVSFIRVFGIVAGGFSISRTMRGSLRGAGDTRWPLYGTIMGMFVLRLPIASLALPAGFAATALGFALPVGFGLGFPVVFLALIVDFYTRATVNTARFWSGKWQLVATASGVESVGASNDD